MTIRELQEINKLRCEEWHPVDDWDSSEWIMALIGEFGELANYMKKRRRGDGEFKTEIRKELADVQCYLLLLAEREGVDLQSATIEKFNEVSERRGSPFYITDNNFALKDARSILYKVVLGSLGFTHEDAQLAQELLSQLDYQAETMHEASEVVKANKKKKAEERYAQDKELIEKLTGKTLDVPVTC